MRGVSDPPVIRSVLPADVEAVARIYVQSANAGFGDLDETRVLDPDQVERWRVDLAATPPYRWWVATRDDAIVGFAGIGPSRDPVDPSIGELDTIGVESSHWRTGVGRALMSQALRHLSMDGYREAIVWTLADYPRGMGFYESTGWRRNGAVRADGRHICYAHPLPAA